VTNMVQDISRSIDVCASHYGDEADAMKTYLLEGQAEALALPNRGPLKFDESGNIHPDIISAYSEFGFYILEGVLSEEELDDIKADLADMRENFPIHMGALVDKHGRPALGADNKAPTLQWARPLSDPLGGTEMFNGRHQVKLFEPKAADDAPPAVPLYLSGSDIHGFNFMGQVYGSTAVNGVWVIPGSHKAARANIAKMVEDAGSERLPNAMPIICNPGDVVINSRQIIHGSFANTGFEPRLSINFGFHKRTSVLNIRGAGMHAEAAVMDEAFIDTRSRLIGFALDARRQRFPNEMPYHYAPFAERQDEFRWNAGTLASLKDYNLMDLSI